MNPENREDSLPEILGMQRIDRPKAPVGKIDQEEQERFKEAATEWLERRKNYEMPGVVFTYRIVPEKLLTIECEDYDGLEDLSPIYQGQRIMRSYYPRGASSDLAVTARAILDRKSASDVYQVETIFKDIEGERDHRNIHIGGIIDFDIYSPTLVTTIRYGEVGKLLLFEFDVDEKDNEGNELLEMEEVTIHDIEYSGGWDYTTMYGQKVHYDLSEDRKHVIVTSAKGERTRILKVPVQVDLEKIRTKLEEGLNLEDPYNDSPDADRWREKDLEKVVGIMDVA